MESQSGYDEYFKKVMSVFGRRKGELWRADRQWYATDNVPGKTGAEIRRDLEISALQVEQKRNDQTNKGWSTKKQLKWVGEIPMQIMIAHPELWNDEKETRRFFKDFPAFSNRGNTGGMK